MRQTLHGCSVPAATCAPIPPVGGYRLYPKSCVGFFSSKLSLLLCPNIILCHPCQDDPVPMSMMLSSSEL